MQHLTSAQKPTQTRRYCARNRTNEIKQKPKQNR